MSDELFIDDVDGSEAAHLTEEHLLDTQERIGALLDLMPNAIPMGLLVHQMHGVLFANLEAGRMFGAEGGSLRGQHILDFVGDAERAALMPKFMQAFHSDAPLRVEEVELNITDKGTRIANITIGKLDWDGNSVVQVLIQDITEFKMQERELTRLLMTDPLTGAFNRRFFMEQAERMFSEAREGNADFSLLIFDIDHFKSINDGYGHAAGDEVLKTIVHIWDLNTRQRPREEDKLLDGHLARIGGEEFAIVIPGRDVDHARRAAERVRQVIEEAEIHHGDQVIKLTVSIGVTEIRDQDARLDDMFSRADAALYDSKTNGRNRVTVA